MRKVYIDELLLEKFNFKYPNRETLTKKELASELGVSVSSINHYIQLGEGLPSYIKFGNSEKGRVLFPIVNVVEYLTNTELVS
jgi:transposase